MADPAEVLLGVRSVLVIDWPSRDVPDTLVAAGYAVFVKGGPGETDYSVREMMNGQVIVRPSIGPPETVDLVYAHRPLDELPGILSRARALQARAVWWQSGRDADGVAHPRGCSVSADASRDAHTRAAAAGLAYVDSVYIADAVRQLVIKG